jgi:hypothetical protein
MPELTGCISVLRGVWKLGKSIRDQVAVVAADEAPVTLLDRGDIGGVIHGYRVSLGELRSSGHKRPGRDDDTTIASDPLEYGEHGTNGAGVSPSANGDICHLIASKIQRGETDSGAA